MFKGKQFFLYIADECEMAFNISSDYLKKSSFCTEPAKTALADELCHWNVVF